MKCLHMRTMFIFKFFFDPGSWQTAEKLNKKWNDTKKVAKPKIKCPVLMVISTSVIFSNTLGTQPDSEGPQRLNPLLKKPWFQTPAADPHSGSICTAQPLHVLEAPLLTLGPPPTLWSWFSHHHGTAHHLGLWGPTLGVANIQTEKPIHNWWNLNWVQAT